MNVRSVLNGVAVCAANAVLLAGTAIAQTSAVVKVSDGIEAPANQFTGAVSAARCGTNIVVGFGDQESSPTNSFAGYALSRNNGATFSDLGVLPVSQDASGGSQTDALGADLGFTSNLGSEYPAARTPSLACVNSSLFYYASVYTSWSNADFGPCITGPMCAAISLSTSTNGGVTWALPKPVAIQSGDIHDLIYPTMTVDPSNTQRLYVAYVLTNLFGPADSDVPCVPSYALRLASSSDAGKTWADRLVDFGCLDGDEEPSHNGEIAWPSTAVAPDGKLDLAYLFIPQGTRGQVNQIRFSRSLDFGQSFSAPLQVSALMGNVTPKLSVDRTNSPHRGAIYLTWSGQPSGTYTSVLESDSLNGGDSFSFPRPVNGTPGTGLGRFQANPVIAVDNDGQVQVCYYNTPTNTPTSRSVYSYNCATSSTHAATWQLQRVSDSAVVGYDTLTSDFLTHHDGFFTAFELQANGVRHVAGQFSDLN
jgi:hypothetical protein